MAKAIIARQQGDDYQARWFWYQVCRMFFARSKVTRVGFEKGGVRGFDDVFVAYADGMIDEHGNPLQFDCYQVKYHTTAGGSIGWQGLIDPAFINATKFSLLQRLMYVQQQYAPDGTGCRFHLYTPWSFHPEDPLASVHSQSNGCLIWSKLAQGTVKSALGEIRAAWRDHLGIRTEAELQVVLRPLRIVRGPSLEQLKNDLNLALLCAGLAPIDDGVLLNMYDELARKLYASGRNEFTKEEIVAICKQEGLWRGRSELEPDAYRIGVRSFLRWAEHLEDNTDSLVCLIDWFDGRKIKAPELWQSAVFPKLNGFLHDTVQRGRRHLLHLDTHCSIAFAAGYCLDSKSGVDVAPVQSTSGGQMIWRPQTVANLDAYPRLNFAEEIMRNDSSDIAIALNITHDVLSDVREYVARSLPQVGRVISCAILPSQSNQVVLDGTHAKLLVDQIASQLKIGRTASERQGRLHFFIAAPNGLVFFLGQLARSFGPCVLYEYNFETNALGAYEPSLALPPGHVLSAKSMPN